MAHLNSEVGDIWPQLVDSEIMPTPEPVDPREDPFRISADRVESPTSMNCAIVENAATNFCAIVGNFHAFYSQLLRPTDLSWCFHVPVLEEQTNVAVDHCRSSSAWEVYSKTN